MAPLPSPPLLLQCKEHVSTSLDTGCGGPWDSDTRIQSLLTSLSHPYWGCLWVCGGIPRPTNAPPCGLHRSKGLISDHHPMLVLKDPELPPNVVPWAEDAPQGLPASSKVPSYRDNQTLTEEGAALRWEGTWVGVKLKGRLPSWPRQPPRRREIFLESWMRRNPVTHRLSFLLNTG